MFFPYRDDNPHTRLPAVTLFLIVVNTFIFFLFGFSPNYENIVELFGFTPARFNLLTLFTSIFLHGSIMHLIGNMWFFWLFGDNLEDKFGRATFLVFYLFGGIVASLIHSIASAEALRSLPSIGASGAISAVMGGYVVFFPKAKVNCVFWFLYRFFFIKLSAFVFLGLWFLEQLLSGAYYASINATQIAYGAHIGGFLYGVGMSFLVKKFFLTPQELLLPEQKLTLLAKEEVNKEIDSAIHEEKKEIRELDDYKKAIENYLAQGEIDLAVKKYIEFEQQSLSGALSPNYQKLIAEVLLKENKKLLALQALVRFLSFYKEHPEAGTLNCKLGLLLIQDFKNIAEGLKYLNHGLKFATLIKDVDLLNDAQREFAKINSFLNQRSFSLRGKITSQDKFVIMAKFFEESLRDERKIFQALLSIGIIKENDKTEGKNIGLKLAYNAKENFRNQYGIILDDLDIYESELAVNKLEAVGIPVVVIKQDDLLKFSALEYKTEVFIDKDIIQLKNERAETVNLTPADVYYLYLGQIQGLGYSTKIPKEDDKLVYIETLKTKEETPLMEQDKLTVNRLLDIFTTKSHRYRLASEKFHYLNRINESKTQERSFEEFIEDIALLVGGQKIDERIQLFISEGVWTQLNFKSLGEFNQKALFAVRLEHFYNSLIK